MSSAIPERVRFGPGPEGIEDGQEGPCWLLEGVGWAGYYQLSVAAGTGINALKRQERGKHGGEPPPQVIINALSPSQYFAV